MIAASRTTTCTKVTTLAGRSPFSPTSSFCCGVCLAVTTCRARGQRPLGLLECHFRPGPPRLIGVKLTPRGGSGARRFPRAPGRRASGARPRNAAGSGSRASSASLNSRAARPSSSPTHRPAIAGAAVGSPAGAPPISPPAIVMRGLERQAVIAHQRIGQLRQRRPAVRRHAPRGASASKSAVRIAAATSFTGARRVAEHREHERLQVVFGVDDVAERRVVHGGDDRLRLAERLAADGARVLERDWVALLRHDAARTAQSRRRVARSRIRRWTRAAGPARSVRGPTSSTAAADALSSR